MGLLSEKLDISGFDVNKIDISEITRVEKWLPIGRVIDLNTAEKGLILTLHAQNVCQEQIAKLDCLIGILDSSKSKAWSNAALNKTDEPENKIKCKTAKAKEWFAQSDVDYISASNKLSLARAAKRYLENKASYFSGWHYAFKTFLRRDYSLEKSGSFQNSAGNIHVNEYNSNAQADESSSDDSGWAD